MLDRFVPNYEKIRGRYDAFWAGEVMDRCLISVAAPKRKGDVISWAANPYDFTKDPIMLNKYWNDPETIFRIRMEQFERTSYVSDQLPIICPNFGTNSQVHYFKPNVTYGNSTVWYGSVWDELEDGLAAECDESIMNAQVEIVRQLAELAKGQCIVGMPDHNGEIDAISHLLGSEKMLFATMEDPDLLCRISEKLDNALRKSHDLFYEAVRTNNENYSAIAFMALIAPGHIGQLQADLAVTFSADTFEKIILPELYRQTQWYDYSIYHLDGQEQRRHLDHLLSLDKLDAIQWTNCAGQPSPAHYMDSLKKIQNAGKKLLIMTPPDDIPILLQELSSKGLALVTRAEDEQAAVEIVKYVEKHTHD